MVVMMHSDARGIDVFELRLGAVRGRGGVRRLLGASGRKPSPSDSSARSQWSRYRSLLSTLD